MSDITGDTWSWWDDAATDAYLMGVEGTALDDGASIRGTYSMAWWHALGATDHLAHWHRATVVRVDIVDDHVEVIDVNTGTLLTTAGSVSEALGRISDAGWVLERR